MSTISAAVAQPAPVLPPALAPKPRFRWEGVVFIVLNAMLLLAVIDWAAQYNSTRYLEYSKEAKNYQTALTMAGWARDPVLSYVLLYAPLMISAGCALMIKSRWMLWLVMLLLLALHGALASTMRDAMLVNQELVIKWNTPKKK